MERRQTMTMLLLFAIGLVMKRKNGIVFVLVLAFIVLYSYNVYIRIYRLTIE